MDKNLFPTRQQPLPIDWPFLVKWIGANIGGWLIGSLMSVSISTGLSLTSLAFEQGWDIGLVVRLEALVTILMIGAIIGLIQGLVLRTRLPLSLYQWVLATAMGWTLPQLPGFLLEDAGLGAAFALGIVIGLATGVVVGAMQWLVLQQHLPQAGWWIGANSLGWLVCWLFTPLAIAISAAATGGALLWLLDQTKLDAEKVPATSLDEQDEAEPDWLRTIKTGQSLTPDRKQERRGLFARLPTLKQTLYTWQQATLHPNLHTFQAERSRTDVIVALFWMLAVGLINGLSYVLVTLLFSAFLFNNLLPGFLGTANSPDLQTLFGDFIIFAAILNGLVAVVMAPASLLIVSGILFVIARLSGGQGSFQEQTYLIATFFAPLSLLSGTVGLIPLVGSLIVFGLLIYQIILGWYAIQVSHPQLNAKQAWIVILIPVGAVIGLFGVFFILWFLLLFGPGLMN